MTKNKVAEVLAACLLLATATKTLDIAIVSDIRLYLFLSESRPLTPLPIALPIVTLAVACAFV